MIQISDIQTASFPVRLKAKATRTRELDNCVYVMPLDESKDRRAVIFLAEGILCVSTDGEQCKANEFSNVCYHCVAAHRRKQINAKRRATIQKRRAA
jgi:hypothetical protein